MTCSGSGQASSPTRSARPAAANRSIRSPASCRTDGVSSRTRRGVNVAVTSDRTAVCAGGSSLSRTRTSGYPVASTSATSGAGCCWLRMSKSLLNRSWSVSTVRTSPYLATSQRARVGSRNGGRVRIRP